jgi:MYXO-CTERM domain-containing protein
VQVERRDPVLVNMIGPDRVMMQCFPVPEKGGRMKVRMGITAPVDATTQSRLWMPSLLERNFIAPAPHLLRLRSDTDFAGSQSREQTLQPSTAELGKTFVTMNSPTGTAPVWTEDRFAIPAERFLRRDTSIEPSTAWGQVCVVVDTSIGNATAKPAVRTALEKLIAQGTQLTLLLPHDSGFDVITDQAAIVPALQSASFVGGRDNTGAVHEALRLAKTKGAQAMVLWLHGAQPLKFEESAVGTYNPTGVMLCPIALSPGPNRVLEHLYREEPVQAPRSWSTGDDLVAAMMAPPTVKHRYTRTAAAPTDDSAKVSDQLARHWAFAEVMKAFRGMKVVPSDQAALASRYQLVTPYSGAVVLETQAQYDRAGLAAIDPNFSPHLPGTTPEPGGALLVLIAGGIGLLRRRRESPPVG